MKADDVLLGWLSIIRHNLNQKNEIVVPNAILRRLAERGWVRSGAGQDDDELSLTQAGALASDLSMPEWGIDPLEIPPTGETPC